MVSPGTNALETILAIDIVIEDAVRHLPGSVLGIGEGIEIDHWSAEGGSHVDRPRVVCKQQGRHLQQGRQFRQFQPPRQ